jgi:hypothetical protein
MRVPLELARLSRDCAEDSVGVDWMNQSKNYYGVIEIFNEIMNE